MRTSKTVIAALLAATMAAGQAQALTFNFIDQAQGGAEIGTKARKSFQVAADYWSSIFTNTATVNIAIGYYSLGEGNEDVLGSAGSARYVTSIDSFDNRIQATKSDSGIDQKASANVPARTSNGGIAVITPGYVDQDPDPNVVDKSAKLGIDTSTRVYDTDGSVNNRSIYMTTANAKALGYLGAGGVDAQIQFNADFGFDFDPTDGVDGDKYDFTLVAIHEIGHALGFVSGVDDYDYFGGPSGPCFSVANIGDCGIAGQTYDANDDYWGSTLDLFRYSRDADNVAPGAGPVLDWSIRNPSTDPAGYPDYTANPYFSIDGGLTKGIDGEDAYFSRGQFNGASYQASHWRIVNANNGAGVPRQEFLGIMDPVGRTGNSVTALDIAAFDAIGWNSTVDAAARPGYSRGTASIFAAFVPEPATWAQMILGFGVVGFGLRRRRTAAVAA